MHNVGILNTAKCINTLYLSITYKLRASCLYRKALHFEKYSFINLLISLDINIGKFLAVIYGQSLTGHIHMKYKQIILDTRKMLGFRLTDVKQSLGVTTGVKLSVKVGGKAGAKIGSKTGSKRSAK